MLPLLEAGTWEQLSQSQLGLPEMVWACSQHGDQSSNGLTPEARGWLPGGSLAGLGNLCGLSGALVKRSLCGLLDCVVVTGQMASVRASDRAQKGCEARAVLFLRVWSQKLAPSLIFFLAGSYFAAQAGLEPMTLLHQPPECWEY